MARDRQTDDYKPKWRHFNPGDRVTIQNPFDHDITWDVFDETRNAKVTYRVGANQRAELTGGLVHTLGVKRIVDEMMQQDKKRLLMNDIVERAKYEEQIILRLKSAPSTIAQRTTQGHYEVDLSSNLGAENEEAPMAQAPTAQAPAPVERPQEEEFPELNDKGASSVLEQSTKGLPRTQEVTERDVPTAPEVPEV